MMLQRKQRDSVASIKLRWDRFLPEIIKSQLWPSKTVHVPLEDGFQKSSRRGQPLAHIFYCGGQGTAGFRRTHSSGATRESES